MTNENESEMCKEFSQAFYLMAFVTPPEHTEDNSVLTTELSIPDWLFDDTVDKAACTMAVLTQELQNSMDKVMENNCGDQADKDRFYKVFLAYMDNPPPSNTPLTEWLNDID